MGNLAGLLQYCVAQEVKIEFKFSRSIPDAIEMVAHESDAHFSRVLTIEDFLKDAENTFSLFLEEARRELLKQRES